MKPDHKPWDIVGQEQQRLIVHTLELDSFLNDCEHVMYTLCDPLSTFIGNEGY